MSLPDIQVYFNPNENISSQDVVLISNLAFKIHKTFVANAISTYSCRFKGLLPTFPTPGGSPTCVISSGLAFFILPPPSTNDPNGYSGAIFSGGQTFGFTPPISTTRTDSIDITYAEALGASGGVGNFDPRDMIDSGGTITPNVPNHTRKISTYTMTHIQDSDTTNLGAGVGNPAPGTIRLVTFTVTTGGVCAVVPGAYDNQHGLLPSIWENQAWPTGSPNIAEQSKSLIDSLSSMRYQLNAIIGNTNWFDLV